MRDRTLDRDLCGALAALLDYPRAPLGEQAQLCLKLAQALDAGAAATIERFADYVASASVDELQESYTKAFDLDTLSELEPTWYPYVGHQLVEDHSKRSAFLVELSSRYKAHDFDAGTELPDHMVVVLRFVAHCPDEQLAQELVHEGLVPALGKAPAPGERAPASGREHYLALLSALRSLLETQPEWAVGPSVETEPELAMSVPHDPNDPRRG